MSRILVIGRAGPGTWRLTYTTGDSHQTWEDTTAAAQAGPRWFSSGDYKFGYHLMLMAMDAMKAESACIVLETP